MPTIYRHPFLCKSLGFALVCFMFPLLMASCGRPKPNSDHSSTFNSQESENATKADWNLFFKESIDFDLNDAREGSSNCLDIVNTPGGIETKILPWPADLKVYLARFLKEFPQPNLITTSLHGIYLVSSDVMTDPVTKVVTAGQACDLGSTHQGLVFLNYKTNVSRRSALGLGTWQPSKTTSHTYLTTQEGDTAALTLMHEVFHTIDTKIFLNGTPGNFDKRTSFTSLSWSGSQSRFPQVQAFALAGAEIDEAVHSRCQFQATGMELTNDLDNPQALANELLELRDHSNFIVPYAATNPSEDFAESLTVYYFGTKYRSWQRRTVESSSKTYFIHDTGTILQSKTPHKEKLCMIANMILGSCDL